MKKIALASLLILVTFIAAAQKEKKLTERKLYLAQIKAAEALLRLNETGEAKKILNETDPLNLKDSLIYNPSGKWRVADDKLVMVQQFPSADTTTYSFLLEKDTVLFECIIDWDKDGMKDDNYFGKQTKIQEQ